VTPEAVPVAFWDFDGTLLEGDCVDGYWRGDGAGYGGLVERAILGGLCPAYAGAEGVVRCERDFRALLRAQGKAAAYAFQSQIFAGVPEAPLLAAARTVFDAELSGWLFAEALAWWRALERAGVRCWVLSASPEFFVKAAAAHLGVPEARCTGMRLQREPDGRLRAELAGPPTVGEGKTRRMHQLLAEMAAAEPGRAFLPVAAFGNDVVSDGPMIEAVRRAVLPAGEAVGVYVNLPEPLPDGAGCEQARFRPRVLSGANALR
jgi:HAD superfamily phosphoserine phosphatase-like hydrolase